MEKYSVLVEEMLTRVIEVLAEDEEEAEKIVMKQYKNSEIVLDSDDLCYCDVKTIDYDESGVIL